MLLYYIVIIMITTGIFGGVVNYFSDANEQKDNGIIKRIRSVGVCILFGLAATVLVPLFLKFADSKLLEEIYFSEKPSQKEKKSVETESLKTANYKSTKQDSIQAVPKNKDSIISKNPENTPKKETVEEQGKSLASNYLIWTAYCLLAACAGMRFIDLLMSRVISKEYMNKIETDKQELTNQNKVLKNETKTFVNNYKVSEPIQLKDALDNSTFKNRINALDQSKLLLSELPAITHSNDPQKGRFGGKSNVNGKTLTVSYSLSNLAGVLNLIIKVSAAEEDLNSDVYLFLHNSFAKSIIHLDGYGKKDVEYKIPAYGAFTIGAIVDNGNTLLELDIAELKNFPEDFRNK